MKIAGFWNGHDCSYCILENGIPTIHAELERHIRKKEPSGDSAGLFLWGSGKHEFLDIDKIALADGVASVDKIFGFTETSEMISKDVDLSSKVNEFKQQGNSIVVGHHLAHAANTFFSSNLDESLIITVDGGGMESPGNPIRSGAFVGIGNKIEETLDLSPHGIGRMWTIFTGRIFAIDKFFSCSSFTSNGPARYPGAGSRTFLYNSNQHCR